MRRRFLRGILLCAAVAAGGRIDGGAQALPQLDSNAVLGHLNAVIKWYRQATTGLQPVGLPSDAIYQSDLQSMAVEAAQLAFQSATAEAALIPASGKTSTQSAGANLSQQNIDNLLNTANARIAALQSQISALDKQISATPKSTASDLTAQRDQLQGELDLNNALRDAIEQMVKFVELNGESQAGGLEGGILQLQRSVPELAGTNPSAAKPAATHSSLSNSQGLIGEVITVYDYLESMHRISQLASETAGLRNIATALRTPLQATLRATIQQGQQMASAPAIQPGQTAAAPAQPLASRQQFDALAARFKQISNATLPLSKEIILLDQSRSTLLEWRNSVEIETNRVLRSVLLRVAAIAIAIFVVLLLSEIWRRISFRYIRDVRRRRQFLLVRRIVVTFAMGIVLILGFVSEFSSLATFAGFITAGLAVGLQTILLSVAAYFFLVGRWGIRVGDRISVAGVTGDVVDVGLVRIYLMELAGTGLELYPTGRIVVFANSVLFQAATPLFKQLPGAEYSWHEVVVPLKPEGNLKLAEEKLLEAVHSIYAEYREDFAKKHGIAERQIDIPLNVPEPQSQLSYSDKGLEYVIRYPVALDQVAEVDDKITRKLLELIAQQPDLKETFSGLPTIQAAIKS